MKALVVYYSRTGNTRAVAERIAQELGAEIEEVLDKKKRSGALGFLLGGKDATMGNKTEIAETSKNPAAEPDRSALYVRETERAASAFRVSS